MSPDVDPETLIDRRRNTVGIGLIIAMVSLALAFLIQFGGSIWWGATLSADVRHLAETLRNMEIERYTKSDAIRDNQRIDQRASDISDRLRRLEERVDVNAAALNSRK